MRRGEPSPHLVSVAPDALVVLIGAAGSGKSTFAGRQFPGEAVISSDQLRDEVADRNRRRRDVFDQLLERVDTRLSAGRLTVVDATNTDWMRRGELIRMARRQGRQVVAIVFSLPLDVTLSMNASRPDAVPASMVRRQVSAITRDIDRLDLEGFSTVLVLRSRDEADQVQIRLTRDGDVRANNIAPSGS